VIGHIRRASTDDIDAIIRVHRASVTELCAKDYNVEQIAAWISKHSTDAGKQRWADKIQNDFVWVTEGTRSCVTGAEDTTLPATALAPSRTERRSVGDFHDQRRGERS